MAKKSGTFDLTTQGWIFYAAIIFSIFYGFRLFRMAKGKLAGAVKENQDSKSKKEMKKTLLEPDVIPEEESGESGNAPEADADAEAVANVDADDNEGKALLSKDGSDHHEEISAEEKKSK